MTKRLQIQTPDDEYERLKQAAHRHQTSMANFARNAIRLATNQPAPRSTEEKLAAMQRAVTFNFPTPD